MSGENGALRVLVVNADGDSNGLQGALARDQHYRVETAADPEKALELLVNGGDRFHSVVIDAGNASRFAHLLEETRRRIRQLEALQRTSVAITEARELNRMPAGIIEQAVELLHAKNGGVYKYNPANDELVTFSDYRHPERVGAALGRGGEWARELVAGGRPYVAEAHHEEPATDGVEEGAARRLSLLGAPMRWRGEVIGVVCLEDEPGREFSPEDARVLQLLADQTAVAIGNADLNARDEKKLKSLEKLAEATREIMSELGSKKLDERLTLIAKHASDILEAEVCYIHLVKRPGVLSLAASYGHREGGFHKGKEFVIHSGHKTGLIGHIAHRGQLFNAHGERLRHHFAVRGERPPHLPSGVCHSMVAYPLKRAGDGGEELIGLLCADNKKDADGRPRSSLEFTPEDEWILKVFGEAVVVALDSASLVSQLQEQRDQLDRLVENSPTSIVAVDEQGRVRHINRRASLLLDLTEQEALDAPLADFYERAETTSEIEGALDESADDTITDFETALRSRSGASIPIRQSSMRLYDARGRRISTVHYIEDMRTIKGAKRRLDYLLKASRILANAHDLTNGLQSLAEMLGVLLPGTYCRIFLTDEDGAHLSVVAAHPRHLPQERARAVSLEDWPDLHRWLRTGNTRLLDWANATDRPTLETVSRARGAEEPIRSLLVVPLSHGDEALGMIEFGGLPGAGAPRAFTHDEVEFATAIAESNINLINRIRLHDRVTQRERLLTKLNEASLHIRAAREPDKLLQEVVRLGVELVGCNMGGLYLNKEALKTLERCVTHRLAAGEAPEQLAYQDGLIGRTAEAGESNVSDSRHGHAVLGFDMRGLKSCATIPLKNEAGEVEAVLFVASDEAGKRMSRTDVEMLERFAAQAAIALQTSQMVTREQRDLERLSTQHRISRYIQVSKDLGKTLHVLLTGVTAGYGLSLNRAAVFFLDGREEFVVGQSGIGHVEEELAREDWARDQKYGVNDFNHYIGMLEENALPETPIGKRVHGLRIPLNDGHADLFASVLRERVPRRIGHEDWHRLPESFVEAFEPSDTLAVVPLEVADQKLGLLVADNKFTHAPITDEDLNLLHTFANTAAAPAHNLKLLDEQRVERERLHTLFQASNVWSQASDPREVLREIIGRPPLSSGAAWVRIILIDNEGQPWKQILGGTDKKFELRNAIRPGGVSMQVMATGEPVVIEDTSLARDRINPFLIREKIKAALCLPFTLRGRPIGVMWINYYRPRAFHPYEIEALQLYVNHAAVAYDNARRMDELRGLHEAAKAMALAFNSGLRRHPGRTAVDHVLQAIVEQACELFEADSSTLWSYDHGQEKFLPNELRAVGISEANLEVFREEEPDPQGTTITVLKEGWLPVEDTSGARYDFIRPRMRKLLRECGVRSFQGITLKVGEEPVAVLYVGYKNPRSFGDKDRPPLENFATYAALALKNARLVDQVIAAKRATEIVAQESVLTGEHAASLQSVADATLKGAKCDAVVLYGYDERANDFSYPPTHKGVRYGKRAWPGASVPSTSMVYDIVQSEEMVVVEDVAKREEFNRRFAREEEIKSCVAIPLRVGAGREKVGVMFVNYREAKRFRAEELVNIKLFADQAAVALKNWQVLQQAENRRKAQEALVGLSRTFLETTDVSEIMKRAANAAGDLLGVDICNIVTPNKRGNLVLCAAYGLDESLVGRLEVPAGERSQTGYTMLTRAPVVVDDYSDMAGREFTVPQIVHDLRLRSGVSVPMLIGGAVRGAMLVHSKTRRRFSEEEINLLTLIANQTSIAMASAERYGSLDALCAASGVLWESVGLDVNQVLDKIVMQAVTSITGRRGSEVVMGTLHRYDEKADEIVCVSLYSSDGRGDLLARVGEHRPLAPARAPDGKIGVTGMAVRDRRPQLVPDVREAAEYVVFHESTKSELAVPLLDRNHVIGVLNVESSDLAGFDENDEKALKIFSGMAVTAIRNAEYIGELKRVGARTALAWMGIASNMWWHKVLNKVVTIRNNVENMRHREKEQGRLPAWADESLTRIMRKATEVLAMRITPPLKSEEGLADLNINALITERLKQLEQTERYGGIAFGARPDAGEVVLVRTDPAWLRFALDQLLDNAAKAVRGLAAERRVISVETRASGPRVEIVVNDLGAGMRDEIAAQLFQKQVEGTNKGEGLGMGLLIAEAIIEAYGGTIEVRSTGFEGTTVAITLPRRTG